MTDETTMSESQDGDREEAEMRQQDRVYGGIGVRASNPNVEISENNGPHDKHYLEVRTEKGAKQLGRFAAAVLKGDTLSVNDVEEVNPDDLEALFDDDEGDR